MYGLSSELAGTTDDPSGGEGEDATLVERARTDPEAFGMLYRRYLDRVYRYLRSRTVTAAEAEELTQQTFLRAYEALPRYRARGLPAAVWFFRIARNLAIDAHRRRRVTMSWDSLPEALQPAAQGELEADLLRLERLARLRELLLELSPEKRELLALRFIGELTVREIAAVVGKREAAVQKRLVRTLHALKEQYDAG